MTRTRAHVAGAALSAVHVVSGCGDPAGPTADASVDAAPPWGSVEKPPAPRPGMVWIPEGTLVAGTPPDAIPRVPDAEMPGVPIEMKGFYVDRFPLPNEPGAIATTNVTHDEARKLCEEAGKRLCTELELEYACKGPDGARYPYGQAHRPDVCGTGGSRALVPNGLHAGCKSGFGVHDTHGTVWVWTSTAWGRDTNGLVAIRGGNGPDGELVGRCAHGAPEKPDTRRPDLGVRCCAGPENPARVQLSVERGSALKLRVDDEALAARLEERVRALAALAEGPIEAAEGRPPGDEPKAFDAQRTWIWRPAGNEELTLAGGCVKIPGIKKCGVLVARVGKESVTALAFVLTDKWQPTVSESETAREIFVHGGDDHGAFRKRVSYEWGKIGIGEKQRKKRHKKGRPRYD